MNIGARLKEERELLGMSQSEFAEVADAKKHAQINWEKGVTTPNGAALEAWSRIGVDILYVVTGKRGVRSDSAYPEDVVVKATKGMLYDASIIKVIQISSQDDYDLLIKLMLYNLKKATDTVDMAPAGAQLTPKVAGAE